MKARLCSNENFPLAVVEALRNSGHDVATAQETGMANRRCPDAEVLDFAIRENRAVLTLNRRHFIRLHQERPEHKGIIVCTFDPDFAGQSERIQAQLDKLSTLDGLLVRVTRPSM